MSFQPYRDMNINLDKVENSSYYLKKLAEEYQTLIFENQFEVLNYGITWRRIDKEGNVKESAVDHAFTNNLVSIHKYFKTLIDYSDHHMISVDLYLKIPKPQNSNNVCRDMRKMRNNPKPFLDKLAEVRWELFKDMRDVEGKTVSHFFQQIFMY